MKMMNYVKREALNLFAKDSGFRPRGDAAFNAGIYMEMSVEFAEQRREKILEVQRLGSQIGSGSSASRGPTAASETQTDPAAAVEGLFSSVPKLHFHLQPLGLS